MGIADFLVVGAGEGVAGGFARACRAHGVDRVLGTALDGLDLVPCEFGLCLGCCGDEVVEPEQRGDDGEADQDASEVLGDEFVDHVGIPSAMCRTIAVACV